MKDLEKASKNQALPQVSCSDQVGIFADCATESAASVLSAEAGSTGFVFKDLDDLDLAHLILQAEVGLGNAAKAHEDLHCLFVTTYVHC